MWVFNCTCFRALFWIYYFYFQIRLSSLHNLRDDITSNVGYIVDYSNQSAQHFHAFSNLSHLHTFYLIKIYFVSLRSHYVFTPNFPILHVSIINIRVFRIDLHVVCANKQLLSCCSVIFSNNNVIYILQIIVYNSVCLLFDRFQIQVNLLPKAIFIGPVNFKRKRIINKIEYHF